MGSVCSAQLVERWGVQSTQPITCTLDQSDRQLLEEVVDRVNGRLARGEVSAGTRSDFRSG